ncbi:uncharacterized protein F5147DRAFT_564596, partial [Suillus discolor]
IFDLMENSAPQADFTFLSACHTAVGDERTLDEVIHLAADLQFSGFKNVIGTLEGRRCCHKNAVSMRKCSRIWRTVLWTVLGLSEGILGTQETDSESVSLYRCVVPCCFGHLVLCAFSCLLLQFLCIHVYSRDFACDQIHFSELAKVVF